MVLSSHALVNCITLLRVTPPLKQTSKAEKNTFAKHASYAVFLPGTNIQFAAVDDARELKQNGKPAANPHPITRGDIHVVTGVFPQGLQGGKQIHRV